MAFLELRDVTRNVRLPDHSILRILKGVEFGINLGQHVSIQGRSGTGKSTLLNILGLLDSPTSGTYLFDGRPVHKASNASLTRRRGRDIGFVFQQFNLLPARSALENVAAPLLYATGRDFWQRNKLAAEMLDRLGLKERIHSFPEQLSGGEQQRVAIARALVRRPRLILADEPTGALDLETGREIMAVLDQAATEDGAALITITHDAEVASLARTRYLLQDGRLWRRIPQEGALVGAPAGSASATAGGAGSDVVGSGAVGSDAAGHTGDPTPNETQVTP